MAKKLNVRNLLALLIVVLAGALVATVAYNFRGVEPREIIETLPRNVDLSLKKINYTETREGKRIWTLTADSVDHSASDETTRLENIRMTFYDVRGDVVLTAERGELREREREVTVSGDVVVENPDYALRTERLQYHNADRSIRTSEPVRLVGERMEVTGVGMRLDIETRQLKLLSAVEARIAETSGGG